MNRAVPSQALRHDLDGGKAEAWAVDVSHRANNRPLSEAERLALQDALRAEDAMYERLFEEYGSFSEAVFDWLDENPD